MFIWQDKILLIFALLIKVSVHWNGQYTEIIAHHQGFDQPLSEALWINLMYK